MEEYQKLALTTATWGSLAVLTWFFPLVGFIVLVAFTLFAANNFTIAYKVHEHMKEVEDDGQLIIPGLEDVYPTGTSMGTDGERSLRKNVSESEG